LCFSTSQSQAKLGRSADAVNHTSELHCQTPPAILLETEKGVKTLAMCPFSSCYFSRGLSGWFPPKRCFICVVCWYFLEGVTGDAEGLLLHDAGMSNYEDNCRNL